MKDKKLSKEDAEFYEQSLNLTGLENTKIVIKCKSKKQKDLIDGIKNNDITIAAGPAGSGKTHLACAYALKLLKDNPKKYHNIVLMKSVTTLKDEEIGFLKGGLEEKMEPFVYSYMYIFEKILKNKKILHKLRENDIIKILPLAYIRGVNLDNSIVIIDEAQNLTKDHMITIITRLGSNSKMIFLGDTDQIDRNKKQESALSWLLETFSNFEGIQTIRLTNEDVVRNPLVSKIIDHLKNNQDL